MNNPLEDICMWPDESWCYLSELPEMTHKNEDYYIILVDTTKWLHFTLNSI